MAKDNQRMPSSSAGVVSYNEDMHSKVHLTPGHVVIIIAILILAVAALHYFGQPLLG